jgi:hypothetical protein
MAPNYNKRSALNARKQANFAVRTSVLPSIQLEGKDRLQPSVGGVVFNIDKY